MYEKKITFCKGNQITQKLPFDYLYPNLTTLCYIEKNGVGALLDYQNYPFPTKPPIGAI